jgi:hypothetical protein
MVFCYECDTLYPDLKNTTTVDNDINHFDPSKPIFSCPKCTHAFEYYFMKNSDYEVTRDEWTAAGYDTLLV